MAGSIDQFLADYFSRRTPLNVFFAGAFFWSMNSPLPSRAWSRFSCPASWSRAECASSPRLCGAFSPLGLLTAIGARKGNNKFPAGKLVLCSGFGLRRGKRRYLVLIDLKSCFPRFDSRFGLLVGPGRNLRAGAVKFVLPLNQFAQL